VSDRDIAQATPQGLAPFPSTDTAAERARRDADTGHPVDKGAIVAAGAVGTAATRALEHHRDEQTAHQIPPSDQHFVVDGPAVQYGTDVCQQATDSPSDDRYRQTGTTTNDLEGLTCATGDAPDRGCATDTGADSGRDIAQATPQGLASFLSTDTAAEKARRDADTGHPVNKGAAAVIGTAQQAACQAPPSDSLFAQGGQARMRVQPEEGGTNA
jgi:hypothetical protein